MKYSRLIILICLVISIIAWSVFIIPKYFQYQELNTKLKTQKSFLDNQNKYYSQLGIIENRINEATETIKKIDTAIPSDSDLSTLVTFFEFTAKETGILIKSITIGSPATKSGQERLKENSFNISLVGTYNSFKNFLTRIENSARLFEVSDLSFASSKTNSEFFNYNISLKAYSY